MKKQIIFIDAKVENYQSLIQEADKSAEIVILDANRSGVKQITEALAARQDIAAVHIVSHGSEGSLQIGSDILNGERLESLSSQVQQWRNALTEEADILLYGCCVAAGKVGRAFVRAFSQLTGAQVAASTNLTGNSTLGGDWNLEFSTGLIQTPLAFHSSTLASYSGVLGEVHFDLTSVFDRDVIINHTGGVTDSTQDGLSTLNETLVTQSFATFKFSPNGNGLPDSGFFAANAYHPNVQLGYNNTNNGNNAKVLTTNSTSFTFAVTPNQYSQIHLFAISTKGTAGMEVTFNYSDGTTQTSTATVPDWFDEITQSSSSYYLIDGLDRSLDTTGTSYHDANDVAIFGFGFNPNSTKTLQSITVRKTSGSTNENWLGVLGSTGVFADATAPVATSFTPADNATSVAVGANLIVQFSEAVAKGTGNILIKKVADNTVVETIDVTSASVTVSGSTVTINPSLDLVESTQYYVEIAAGAIKDLANNNYGGITGATAWNFTTADTTAPAAPAISSISSDTGTPNDGITNDPTLIFAGTAEANSTVTLFKDGTSIGAATADAAGNWTFDYTGTTLADATYSFTATATDAASNTSTPSAPFTVTVDTTAPTVTVNQDAGQSDPTPSAIVNFAVVFSETVTGFDAADINFTGTTAGGTLTPTITGSSTTYNVAVTGMTTSGNVVLAVNANAATDTAGNPSVASTSTDNSVTYNTVPTLSAVAKSGSEDTAIAFTAADFTSAFSDSDGDALNKIKITSLPANGTLTLSGTPITANQEILAADLGNLAFTPAADFNGSTSFTWNASDGSNYASADAAVNLTIAAVNDAPSFANLGNQSLPTWTNAPQTVPGWANTFNFGPADEAAQAVNDFLVTVIGNASLFTTAPAIAADGTLTYTPNGTPGTATVKVQLRDNGGVANGGADTSAFVTFDITIPPPAVNLSLSTAIGSEAGTSAITVTATAQGAVVGDQTLNLTLSGTADAADFIGTIPTQITIPNGSSTGQVTFTVANDFIDENDETAALTLSISDPFARIVLGTVTSSSFTIIDDDTAGFDISPISGDTSELGSQATFDIKLKTQPTANVTLSFASNNPAESTAAPASVTFTPANWNSYQTVTLTGVDDLVADGNIAYTIVTSADVATTDTKYNNLDPADVTVVNTDNDIPGVTVIQSAGSTLLTEGSATDSYTIQLNTLPTSNVQITATADAQTQISLDGVNFAPAQILTFTPVNGITPQTVTVRAVDDANPEDIHTGSITHAITNSADANYPLTMAVGSVNAQITDNDINYSLTASTASITESNTGTQQINFIVSRSGAVNETSTVDLALGGSATNGADYNNLAVTGTGASLSGNTITFAPNATQATVTLDVIGDRIDEDDETVLLSLVNPTASGTAAVSGSPALTTIADDDTAGFTVNPTSGLNTTEAGGTAIFQVQLNTQPTADVTINLASDNPGEGNPNVPSLTFTAATWNTPQTVIITGANDAVDDDNLLYNIITAAAVSADVKYNNLDAPDISVTNSDDDTAGISVTPISGNTTEAGGTATFSVVLNTQPTADVTINLASDNPAEGNVSTSSVMLNAANWNQPQIVTVTGADDAVDEGDVAYNIITAAAISADSKYNGLKPNDVAVTNLDNDTAGVTVSPISGNTTEASGTATFTVVLDSQPTADVTVSFASSNTAEGTVIPGVTFTAANWNVAQTVTVVGVDELVDDGDISYNITTSITSKDSKYSAINPADVTVTNLDNDTAGVAISTASTNVTEGGAGGSYNIVLTSLPTAPVSINFNPGSQVKAISPITFDKTNWNIPQTVTVQASEDSIAEGTHSSAITHTATSTDVKYNGMAIAPTAVTITDNETAGLAIIQPVGTTDLLEGYGSDVYKVFLNTPPTADVTITITTDGQVSTDLQTLTFTPTNWNIPQTVTVTALDDAAIEGNHVSSITHITTSTDPQYNGIAASPIVASISDNENPGTVTSLPQPSIMAFTDADEKITGSAGNDVIYGRGGNDYLNGGAGDDVLYGQGGDNGLAGGDGNDVLTGGKGFDYINGNADSDIIYADAGSDRIRGGAGSDILFGEDGNDYLAGDLGADTLTGGAGNDVFALALGGGGLAVETADVIIDFTPNQDKIDLAGSLAFNQLNVFQGTGVNSSNTILQDVATGEFLAVLSGVNALGLSLGDFV